MHVLTAASSQSPVLGMFIVTDASFGYSLYGITSTLEASIFVLDTSLTTLKVIPMPLSTTQVQTLPTTEDAFVPPAVTNQSVAEVQLLYFESTDDMFKALRGSCPFDQRIESILESAKSISVLRCGCFKMTVCLTTRAAHRQLGQSKT